MRYVKTFFLLACISCTFLGCKKDTPPNNCENLKNAVITGSKDDVKSLVNVYISQLPSQSYTAQNIDALASSFSKECSISTLVFCFNCILTYPSMTEIQITVTSTQPSCTTRGRLFRSWSSSGRCCFCSGVDGRRLGRHGVLAGACSAGDGAEAFVDLAVAVVVESVARLG